jgi:hypothetical protein
MIQAFLLCTLLVLSFRAKADISDTDPNIQERIEQATSGLYDTPPYYGPSAPEEDTTPVYGCAVKDQAGVRFHGADESKHVACKIAIRKCIKKSKFPASCPKS